MGTIPPPPPPPGLCMSQSSGRKMISADPPLPPPLRLCGRKGEEQQKAETGRLSWSGHSPVTSTAPSPRVPLLVALPATCRGTDEEEDPLK